MVQWCFRNQSNIFNLAFREIFRWSSVKNVFLEILQNSEENTFTRVSFLIKVQASGTKPWYRCFPVNFAKFLRTPFIIEHLWRLLLEYAPVVSIAKLKFLLKSGSHIPKILFYLLQWKPFHKMMKNAFFFILKFLFILKILQFLSWLFGHVEKTAWLES